MMKKYILNIAYFTIISLTFIACKKDDDNNNNNDDHSEVGDPIISITSFNDGDTIQPAATFLMTGTVTYTSEMHGYEIVLHNHKTMQDVFTKSEHDHETSYSFNESWTNNVTDTSTVMFTLKAVKDHDGSITTKTMHVICLP